MKNIFFWVLLVILVVIVLIETGYIVKLRRYENSQGTSPSSEVKGHMALSPGMMAGTQPLMREGAVGWDPFMEMQRMQRAMNRMFNEAYINSMTQAAPRGFGHASMTFDPAIDVSEDAEEYLIKVDLPGVDKDTVSIKTGSNMITIEGERGTDKEQQDPASGFYRSERCFGSFSRAIPFPDPVDAAAMSTETKEGVLIIKLPKKKAAAVQIPAAGSSSR